MPDNAFYQQQSVSDIIGREPAWIVTSGIGLVALITFILVSSTWFIQYPDSLTAPVTLQTSQATVKHRVKLDGHIDKILITDGEQVQRGQALALIESQLDYVALAQLQNILNQALTSKVIEQLIKTMKALVQKGQLGGLQNDFNKLLYQIKSWQRLNQNIMLQHQQTSAKIKSDDYIKLISQLEQKKKANLEQIALAQNEVIRRQELVNKGLLAGSELIQSRQRYFSHRSQHIDNLVNIDSYQMQLNEIQQELVYSQLIQEKSLAEKITDIEQQRLQLLSKINLWHQQHLIVARINGKIFFNQALKSHQFVRQDETLFSIIPPNTHMDAWMKISGKGVGKIRSGLKVQIELDTFSAIEFGMLEGKIHSFSPIPDQQGYLIKLTLPEKLVSSFGIPLDGHPYLQGKGKIITQPRRLLTRFTDKISFAFSQMGGE